MDLTLILAGVIVFGVGAYVILDGFDLGVGILFPYLPDDAMRDTAIASIAPVWDGNETWLVLGGGGLFAVFPLAYSLLLTAFYAPLIIMLLALVFRGVAFEFRFKDQAHKPIWDLAFAGGSTVATFAQGIVLGAFIQGIAVDGRSYAGGWFDWLTPFSIFTGVALVLGYALLGAGWLILKTEGELQNDCFRLMPRLAVVVVIAVAAVSLWTPFLNDRIFDRWYTAPNIFYLSPVPILVAAFTVLLFRAIAKRRDIQPFLLTLGLFVLSYLGLGISLFPYLVPFHYTIWDVASPPESQGFLLVGTVILLPMILLYTAYAYWVFRGKIREDEGYHH